MDGNTWSRMLVLEYDPAAGVCWWPAVAALEVGLGACVSHTAESSRETTSVFDTKRGS